MLHSLLSLPSLITIAGAVMLGYGARRTSRRSPVASLLGFVLVVASLPMHVSATHGLLAGGSSLLLSAAAGLGVVALLLNRDSGGAKGGRQFIVLALASLVGSVLLFFGSSLFGGSSIHHGAPRATEDAGLSASQTQAVETANAVETVATADGESLLVELGPDDNIDEILPLIAEYGGRAERAFPTVSLTDDEDLSQVFIVSGVKKDLLLKLIDLLRKQIEDVDNVEINEPIGLEPVDVETTTDKFSSPLLTNDPLASQQWSLGVARVDAAHRILKDITPVRKAVVAILDTGVDAAHEDIVSSFLKESPATSDIHGHGTHCAGIAGAATNNGKGMASLNWDGKFVEVASYAALGDTGMGTVETMAQAIIDATTDGADVISMSLGEFSLFPVKVVTDAVEFAQKRGVIVVAAAGNSNRDAKMHIPSNIDGVIAVAAVDENNRKASFSNTNTSLSRPIAAPGVNILSLEPNGKYGKKSGTSMATPLVSGLIGVMRAINPELTAEQVYTILEETGRSGPDAAKVGSTIQADAAVRVAAGNIVVRS